MIINFGRIFIYFFFLEFIYVYGEFVYLDIRVLELEKDFIEVFELI